MEHSHLVSYPVDPWTAWSRPAQPQVHPHNVSILPSCSAAINSQTSLLFVSNHISATAWTPFNFSNAIWPISVSQSLPLGIQLYLTYEFLRCSFYVKFDRWHYTEALLSRLLCPLIKLPWNNEFSLASILLITFALHMTNSEQWRMHFIIEYCIPWVYPPWYLQTFCKNSKTKSLLIYSVLFSGSPAKVKFLVTIKELLRGCKMYSWATMHDIAWLKQGSNQSLNYVFYVFAVVIFSYEENTGNNSLVEKTLFLTCGITQNIMYIQLYNKQWIVYIPFYIFKLL